MLLRKVDFPLDAKLGPPQSYAALQGPQHAGFPLAEVAALEFFEKGDGIGPGIGLQQRVDFTAPNRAQWVFSGALGSCGTLKRQAFRAFNAPGASIADAGFGS